MAVPWLLLSLTLFTFFLTLNSSPSHDVVLLLTKIKPSLQGLVQNSLLISWNTSVPLCQWRGLKWVFTNGTQLICTSISSPIWSDLSLSRNPSLRLLSLQLPAANLSGNLPPELGDLANLQSLYLSFNSFRVHENLLSGSIPKPGLPDVKCGNLSVLDFGHNLFTGVVPEFITGFSGLKEFDVTDNKLSGLVPEGLVGLGLEKLNLSCNNFTGVLLDFGGSGFGRDVFEGNDASLCV